MCPSFDSFCLLGRKDKTVHQQSRCAVPPAAAMHPPKRAEFRPPNPELKEDLTHVSRRKHGVNEQRRLSDPARFIRAASPVWGGSPNFSNFHTILIINRAQLTSDFSKSGLLSIDWREKTLTQLPVANTGFSAHRFHRSDQHLPNSKSDCGPYERQLTVVLSFQGFPSCPFLCYVGT